MIRSSFIEGHHFLIARRRGYDMNEVDSVMKRLADTLRQYEQRVADPETGGTVTDLEKARLARLRSEELVSESTEAKQQSMAELSRARQEAAEIVATAREDADSVMQTALSDSAGIMLRRNERSEALITAALSEVKALRARALREINDYHGSKRAEADALIQTARLTSDELVEKARHEAGSLLGRARREHTELERRLAQLRTAISNIEDQFRHLAESTLEQTEIMASMISLEGHDIEDVIEEKQPDVVRLTQPGMTIDLTGTDTDHDEKRPGSDRYVVQPGQTIYERHGGGIRSRLEEEKEREAED
jgi:F0F1-type ATP synthase membrane subunit b/b'